MLTSLKIKVIVGSTRPNRFSEHPARWIFEMLKKQEGVEAELLDLRDYPMPFYNEPISPSMIKEGNYPNPEVKKWAQKIQEADGFILVSPEYNHSTSAVLKNALDSVYAEWNRKAAAFVSYGSVGGGRSVEHLRGIAVELQMAPVRAAVHIPAPWTLVDEKWQLKPGALDGFQKSAEGMLQQLMWWTKALKSAREQTVA